MNPVVLPPLAASHEALFAHQMLCAGVALVLALLHWAMFAFEPRRRENLFCGLFIATFGTLVYANFAILLDPAASTGWAGRLFAASIALAAMSWLLTLHAVFGTPRRWFWRGFAPVAIALGAWGVAAPGPWPVALLVLVLVTAVIAAVEIGHAWRAGRPGARLLGAGMTLFSLLVAYSALRSLNLAPDTPWSVFAPAYGGICAALTLSLFVARSHAELSRRTLAHEHERQALIEAKNAELEGLVAERTGELRAEKGKVDELLYNILPRDTADELKATGRAQPRRFEDVTILFTDFKGFTNTVSAMPADKLVSELNEIFNHFDDLMDRHCVQKIKTIGDAYMAAGGLPGQPPDGAGRVVAAALGMIACLEERNARSAVKWQMRLGVHTGIVVAGVVGKRRLIYDLFGDTVNIASRMESHGTPGRINLSAYSYDLVRARFACDYLGKIDIKGKGEIDMYSVKPPAAA